MGRDGMGWDRVIYLRLPEGVCLCACLVSVCTVEKNGRLCFFVCIRRGGVGIEEVIKGVGVGGGRVVELRFKCMWEL